LKTRNYLKPTVNGGRRSQRSSATAVSRYQVRGQGESGARTVSARDALLASGDCSCQFAGPVAAEDAAKATHAQAAEPALRCVRAAI